MPPSPLPPSPAPPLPSRVPPGVPPPAAGPASACASPSTTSQAQRRSTAPRASRPTVSKVELKGTTPSAGHLPVVWRRPATPVADAGMRIDPPVSEPSASCADPSQRLTPAPEDEPPGTRCSRASHGLIGVPALGFRPTPPNANSTVWVLPTITAPSERNAFTRNPSRCQRSGRARLEPARVGHPSTPYRSLTDTVTPARGPGSSPAAIFASISAAWAKAPSASKQAYAFKSLAS